MATSCNCGWAGLLAEERDPRRHIMAERSSEKLSLQRSQLAVSNRWTGLWTGSVDCMDCWTGLLDPTKLPVKAMMHV